MFSFDFFKNSIYIPLPPPPFPPLFPPLLISFTALPVLPGGFYLYIILLSFPFLPFSFLHRFRSISFHISPFLLPLFSTLFFFHFSFFYLPFSQSSPPSLYFLSLSSFSFFLVSIFRRQTYHSSFFLFILCVYFR
jgi:hypothetical protein